MKQAKAKFKHDKKARHAEICRRAETAFEEFIHANHTRVHCEVSG